LNSCCSFSLSISCSHVFNCIMPISYSYALLCFWEGSTHLGEALHFHVSCSPMYMNKSKIDAILVLICLSFVKKIKNWISLIEKLQSKFERVSMASLNVLQALLGVSSASFHSLVFWAPKNVNRFLFSAEFRYPCGILLDQFLGKVLLLSL
jgi:hypothetical protein